MNQNMKLLIFGSTGLLGKELIKQLNLAGDIEFIESNVDGRVDIADNKAINELVNKYTPDMIVNCAAYTNVESAEEEDGYKLALETNHIGVRNLALTARDAGSGLIHISTDYVFSENKADGYDEAYSNSKPANKYGESKARGENELITIAGGLDGSEFIKQDLPFYIIRTSWVFGEGATNFVGKILKYSQEKEFLTVVTDEIGCPTYTKDLALAIIDICRNTPASGMYHFSSPNSCSRNGFAKGILAEIGIKTEIKEAKLADFPRKASIPNLSILKNNKLPKARKWEEMLSEFFSDYPFKL